MPQAATKKKKHDEEDEEEEEEEEEEDGEGHYSPLQDSVDQSAYQQQTQQSAPIPSPPAAKSKVCPPILPIFGLQPSGKSNLPNPLACDHPVKVHTPNPISPYLLPLPATIR
jgi:hypothetical protein